MKKLERLDGEKFQELSCAELSEIKGGAVSRTVIVGGVQIGYNEQYPNGYTYYMQQDQTASSILGIRTGPWTDSGEPYPSGCADNCNQQ